LSSPIPLVPLTASNLCPDGTTRLPFFGALPANTLAASCSGIGNLFQTGLLPANQATVNAVQSQNQNIRDWIMTREQATALLRSWRSFPNISRFAAEPESSADSADSPWSALAYARDSKSPAMRAAPAPMPAAPAITFATWGQVYGDHEEHSGFSNNLDIGRKTNTWGGTGGGYFLVPGWVSGDTFVIGMFASGTDSRTTNNDGTTSKVTGPGVGGNLMFIRGGFSADATIQDNHYGVNTSVQGFTGLGVDVASETANVQYKFDWKTWWIEPTAGVQVTDSYWDGVAKGLGFTNGHQVRVQGGVRFGATLANWTGGSVQAIFGGYAYNDVLISGGTLAAVAAGNALVPTDQGKTFGRGVAKLNVDASQYFSYYVEGEVRGANNVLGYAGRIGATLNFN
jgi:hypothetical protein